MKIKNKTSKTAQIFWRHAMRYKMLFFGSVCAIILATVASALIPIIYGIFFNVLAGGANSIGETAQKLVEILAMIAALNGVQWLFWRISTIGLTYFDTRVIADLSKTCFSYIHGHSYKFFTNNFVGSLVKRVNRFTRSFGVLADTILWDFIPLVVEAAVVLIVLGLKNSLLALILFVWLLLFIIANIIFSRYKLKYDIVASAADTRITAQLADTITNSATIKIFTGFRQEEKAFGDIAEDQCRRYRTVWNLENVREAVQSFFIIVIEFFMFYIGVRLWQKGIFVIGDFVVMEVYIVRLMRKLWDFGRILRRMYESFADSEEMTEILLLPYEVRDAPRARELIVTRGEIEFKNVCFAYNKGANIFLNMNLRIKPQEKVGIIGPSGGGKSTFVKLLFRFYNLKSGAIYLDRQNIRQYTQESVRSAMSLVPQDPILFHRSLLENIRYGDMSADERQVMRAARLAHCSEFIESFPKKYRTLVGERGVKLSGGERQRVAIARAILKNAAFLVLDEATSSLDSESERLIQDALSNLMNGKTVIVIAHRLSTIMKMDKIIVIDKGRIIEQGTHSELLDTRASLYRRLWELQASGFVK